MLESDRYMKVLWASMRKAYANALLSPSALERQRQAVCSLAKEHSQRCVETLKPHIDGLCVVGQRLYGNPLYIDWQSPQAEGRSVDVDGSYFAAADLREDSDSLEHVLLLASAWISYQC